jgi:hypothetical protein
MADPISIPTSVPPLQVPELEQWIEQRSQELADLISVELTAIVVDSYERFIASLEVEDVITAAGDLSSFDDIPARWQTILGRRVNPHIEGTYLSGGVSAYTQAENARPIPASTAAKWADVVNQNALTYLTGRQNLLSNVGQSVYNAIRNKTQTAIRKGLSVEKLKNEIGKVAKFSEFRADMVARTETSSAYVMGTYEGQQALGEFGPIEKVWYASLDARTRETHFLMHEKYAPINQPFNVNGSPMMVPLDPAGPAEEVIQCRCVVLYLYEGDKRPDGSIAGTPMQQPQQQTAIQQAEQMQTKTTLKEWSAQDIETIDAASQVRGDRSRDPLLSAIYKRQGFDRTPTLIDSRAVPQLSDDHHVLWRGVAGESKKQAQYVEQFKTGELFSGIGTYGNGTYASTSRNTALGFAGNSELGMMQILVPKNARIIKLADAQKAWLKEFDELFEQINKINASLSKAKTASQRAQLQSELDRLDKLVSAVDDQGRWAAMRGYDAIEVEERVGEMYYVILNRSKLKVVK